MSNCVRCHGYDKQGNPHDGTVVGYVCSELFDGTPLKMAACQSCIEEAQAEIARRKGAEFGRMWIEQ